MPKLTKIQIISVLIVLSAFLAPIESFASDYPLQEKLQQCQAAFEKMHSGDLSQNEAAKLRREHKLLVREILGSLNKHNHALMKSADRDMSSKEILENFIAIGSLLEMMATEDLRITDEWGYPLEE